MSLDQRTVHLRTVQCGRAEAPTRRSDRAALPRDWMCGGITAGLGPSLSEVDEAWVHRLLPMGSHFPVWPLLGLLSAVDGHSYEKQDECRGDGPAGCHSSLALAARERMAASHRDGVRNPEPMNGGVPLRLPSRTGAKTVAEGVPAFVLHQLLMGHRSPPPTACSSCRCPPPAARSP